MTGDPSLNLYLDGNVDGFLTKFPHGRDWFLYFRRVSWDADFKMSSSKATHAFSKKKGKTKLIWTDRDTDVFVEVKFDPQYRGSDHTVGWATVLERLALKKSSNVMIFEEIQKPLKRKKDGSQRVYECCHIVFDLLSSFVGSTPKHP